MLLFSSTRQHRFFSLLKLRVTSAAKGLSDATNSSASETTCVSSTQEERPRTVPSKACFDGWQCSH